MLKSGTDLVGTEDTTFVRLYQRTGRSGGCERTRWEVCDICHMGRVTDASVNRELCLQTVDKNFSFASWRIYSAVPGIKDWLVFNLSLFSPFSLLVALQTAS